MNINEFVFDHLTPLLILCYNNVIRTNNFEQKSLLLVEVIQQVVLNCQSANPSFLSFYSTEIKAAAQKQHLFLYFFFTRFDSFIQK